MNIIDGFILVILLVGAYGGYRKGLIMSVAGLFSHLAGLIGAFFLYRPIGDWLNTQFDLAKLLAPVVAKVVPLPPSVAAVSLQKISFAQAIEKVSRMKVPELYTKEMVKMVKELEQLAQMPGVETLGQAVSLMVTALTVSLGVFILLTLIIDRGTLLLCKSFYGKAAPGMVKTMDRLSGMAVGIAKNGLAVLIGLAVLKPVLYLGSVGGKDSLLGTLAEGVGSSQLFPYFFSILSSFNI